MWSGPGQDPGGSAGSGPPTNQELNDMKDQFEQQQLLIAQLKEMLRKSEQTNVTQEKVEEYAHTLTKMKARAKRSTKKEGNKESNVKRLETPASEKISLLRQQLEENRLKLAERGKSQRGIEEMVTQLKAQLDDSQILMNQTPLNLSLSETKQETYSVNSSSQELYNILLNKERRITEITSRIQKLEANILDLQENLKEKDSVIDARTKAITLMSENLSKKGKSTLDALEDTKLQMRKMQENFVELESQMKEENNRLVNEVQQKEHEISSLKQTIVYLEETKQELNVKHDELKEQLDSMKVDVTDSQLNISTDVEKLNLRIKELEMLNADLERKDFSESQGSIDLHELDRLRIELENSNIKITDLEKSLTDEQLKITDYVSTISSLETQIKELAESKVPSSIEKSVVNLDIKLENEEITKLKKQLDESNKNMIKVKAQHKGKIKELNKTIDSFKKMNSSDTEVGKLQDENAKLSQTIAELEEEKGALQLKIMETDSTKDSTNVELINELEKKLSDQAALLTEKDNNIDQLTKRFEDSSNQIEDLTDKLQKLTHLQNVQVKSEITSIQLEEQMDKLELEKQELMKEKETISVENVSLIEKLEALKKEKQEILVKLESYMQENIDLMDKLEKLSAEKVSSAESIEIVEGLTQQEKLELEAYQKNANITADNKASNEHLEENPELNESVTQLTEETSELLQKIELFTVERREVMEKMEQLTHENNQLNLKIKEIENNREVLAETYEQLQNEKEQLDSNLENIKSENTTLEDKIKELENENEQLKKYTEINDNKSEPTHSENLQKDIEEYQALIEIQRQEIKELKVHLMGHEFAQTDKVELEAKISSLQLQYKNILAENDSLVNKIKEQGEHVCQREDIEEELSSARKRITEFEEKIAENIQEIENYKVTLEENKDELVTSTNLINELQSNITALKNEVTHYNDEVAHLNSVIVDLNTAVDHLERENKENSENAENMNVMTSQLEQLKQALTENIEQINEYQAELENNTVTINQLQIEIKVLNTKILDTEHLLESKNDELKSIQKEKEEKDITIQHLNEELKLKDEKSQHFHEIINDFKEKYIKLQQQLEASTGSIEDIKQPLVSKIQELEHKNKEQLEKMKIIAANLKKKTQALQNLEKKYTEANEKWETEQREKETLKEIAEKNIALEKEVEVLKERLDSSHNDFANQNLECQKLSAELQEYKDKFLSLENMNTNLSEEISSINGKYEDAQKIIVDLQNQISEMMAENASIKTDKNNEYNHEMTEKESTIRDLSEQLENMRYTSETGSNALQMKIQELEMFIETQDADLSKYKERVNKLEEGLSFMEERRMSLERTAQELGTQLRQKTDECEEVSQTEDILEKRLSALMSHDEIIEKKLQIMTHENEELHRHLKSVSAENNGLNDTIKQLKELMNSAQVAKEALPMLENEVSELKKLVNILEHDKKVMRGEYEQKLATSKEDIDKIEIELQNQLEDFDKDRRSLAEKNENMSDQIKESLYQQEILSAEIADYKQKLEEQSKILLASSDAYNNLQGEFQQTVFAFNELKEINKIHEDTILKLNEQIMNSNMEIGTIELLRKQLQEKSVELETYQNESSQRQIQNVTDQPKQFDFASVFSVDNDLQNLKQINEDLHEQINALHREKENITFTLTEVQRKLEESKAITSKEEPQNLEELKSLKAQYNSLEMNYGKLTDENATLHGHIANLTEQLQQISSSQNQTPTVFTWPGDEQVTEKKFLNLEANTSENIDNTKEELLNKIKSLEFMLHDVEKQKNDALIHCNALSEELTKLLYENKNQHKLIAQEQITARPTTSQYQDVSLDFESQILPPGAAEITPSDMAQLQEFEFSRSKDIVDFQASSSQPVVEEAIKPKSAYLCYDPDDTEPSKPIDAFAENDDGWGWGPEEAKLEQEYLEKTSSSPQSVQFQGQISLLEEKIKVLEQARERHLEDIKQSQLKSGKLIKKLKEFKTKNEELASQLNKKSDGFDDLNDAIQEELKSQIKNLEKRMKEVNAELEKEKAEKNNILKRVDTLTATHERMVENKEKQDVEIMSWQQRCRELNTKLEQFEWGSEESPKREQNTETPQTVGNEANSEKMKELTATLQELTLDNEELQALLEEQRNLRITAEKAKSVEPIAENMKTEEEYLSILSERDTLLKDLSLANEETIQLKATISKQLQSNEEFQRSIDALNLRNQQLSEEIKNSDKSQFIEDALQQIKNLNIEKQKLIDDQTKNLNIIQELHVKLENLQKESDELVNKERSKFEESILELNDATASLNNRISSLSLENDALQVRINDFEKDKQALIIEIDQKNIENNELNNAVINLNTKLNNMDQHMSSIQLLNSEVTEVKELLTQKEEELAALKETLSGKETEYENKLSETLQQVHNEWSAEVDRRGHDVAENWKMHLDVRENEFLQIEENLKKEIRDLEEKHTTLVNENNELRKNVDAEIRNEVDRISALQQQINDRQQYINELSKIVQEQKVEIEKQKLEISELNSIVTDLNKHIEARNEENRNYEVIMKNKDDLLKEFNEKESVYKTDRERIAQVESELESLQESVRSKDTELQDKENQLIQFSQKIEETSQLCQTLNTQVDEKTKAIDDLSRKLQESQSQDQTYNEKINMLNQQYNDSQQQVANYHAHMQQQYLQIETLNQEVLKHGTLNDELVLKDSELKRLTNLLEEKEREHSISLESKDQESMTVIKQNAAEMDGLRRRLTAMENQYEELISAKDVDIYNLRIQVDEHIKRNQSFLNEKKDFIHVQTELALRTAECDELKAKIEEQNTLMDEESKQLSELREIIQDQVLKIEDLQKELYEKSSYYDALIAEVDLTHKSEPSTKQEKHVKFSDEVEVRNLPAASGSEDLSEPVSRAELDLALYMLHQRDVRCEELTVELMQLLEERDTLQLKLSNALREKELLRSKFDVSSEESLNKSQSSGELLVVPPVLEASLTPEAAQEAIKTSHVDPLNTKLTELKTVGYRKDKTLVDEQELRRLQQLSIMQQHRDEAAKLPPEAAARLVDASYTLSRDVQSPSKVLLNWLWGRSTPKVNNI